MSLIRELNSIPEPIHQGDFVLNQSMILAESY
jgi:hypothetical protein